MTAQPQPPPSESSPAAGSDLRFDALALDQAGRRIVEACRTAGIGDESIPFVLAQALLEVSSSRNEAAAIVRQAWAIGFGHGVGAHMRDTATPTELEHGIASLRAESARTTSVATLMRNAAAIASAQGDR